MSPILGIWASGQQPALNASSFESIATVTVGSGGASTISFSSIPGTYKHLQIRGIARGTAGNGIGNFTFQFNSDTGSNYASHLLEGDGATVSAGANTSTTAIGGGLQPRSGALANDFSATIIDILDYANTNKYKTVRLLSGVDVNGATGYVDFRSGLWQSTNAITSILITSDGTSSTFGQYSSFALYGIKG